MQKAVCTYPNCNCFSIKSDIPSYPGPQPGCPKGLTWYQPVDYDHKEQTTKPK